MRREKDGVRQRQWQKFLFLDAHDDTNEAHFSTRNHGRRGHRDRVSAKPHSIQAKSGRVMIARLEASRALTGSRCTYFIGARKIVEVGSLTS